jgi:hypothetical protein
MVVWLVTATAIGAGEARIRLTGPSEIQPGRTYDLFLQADNTGLFDPGNPGDPLNKTRGIEWTVTGPGYIQLPAPVLPPSPDFFSDPSGTPVNTTNFFFVPPTKCARSTFYPTDAVSNKSLSNVARYSFQIALGYTASLPESGTFTLTDTQFLNASLGVQASVNETPTYPFAIQLSRADFNRNMKVNQADLAVFKACSTGSNIPYDLGSLTSGCTCGTVSVGGQDYLKADFDNDGDVDQDDFGFFQRCYSGDAIADPDCGN